MLTGNEKVLPYFMIQLISKQAWLFQEVDALPKKKMKSDYERANFPSSVDFQPTEFIDK